MADRKYRFNSNAAIPREDLKYALRDPALVNRARSRNECLLCCSQSLNEAGLCIECFSQINEEERRLCEPYFWKVDF